MAKPNEQEKAKSFNELMQSSEGMTFTLQKDNRHDELKEIRLKMLYLYPGNYSLDADFRNFLNNEVKAFYSIFDLSKDVDRKIFLDSYRKIKEDIQNDLKKYNETKSGNKKKVEQGIILLLFYNDIFVEILREKDFEKYIEDDIPEYILNEFEDQWKKLYPDKELPIYKIIRSLFRKTLDFLGYRQRRL